MRHRQVHIMEIISKAEGYAKMGMNWFEASVLAMKNENLYKDEAIHVASYMKYFYGEKAG